MRAAIAQTASIAVVVFAVSSMLILPIAVGLVVRALSRRWAARLAPLAGKIASVALLVSVAAIFLANPRDLAAVARTGAIVAGLLLVLGAFAVGYLLSRRGRAAVLGLGTAQRNVAGAMVVASRDFGDPNILVMVTASVLAGLLVLFPIAWLLSKRAVFPAVGEAIRAYVERAEADLGRDVDWRRVDEPPRPSGGAA